MSYLFCNIGWMKRYEGLRNGDEIINGGKYPEENGFGGEICNFIHAGDGYVYGYVQPTGPHDAGLDDRQIRIENLDEGVNIEDQQVEGVTVFWTAKHPDRRTVIVGWYNNATVYRRFQWFKDVPEILDENEIEGYYIKAKVDDVKLLPLDDRCFKIPRRVPGGMGQSNIWYADKDLGRETYRKATIFKEGIERNKQLNRSNIPVDANQRCIVENIAIQTTEIYYNDLGYTVKSVEADNLGWDLEATLDEQKLLIEVKGLSGKGVTVELTPNEYSAFSRQENTYRLCVVYSTLSNPTLLVCEYDKNKNRWVVENQNNLTVSIKERLGASIIIND